MIAACFLVFAHAVSQCSLPRAIGPQRAHERLALGGPLQVRDFRLARLAQAWNSKRKANEKKQRWSQGSRYRSEILPILRSSSRVNTMGKKGRKRQSGKAKKQLDAPTRAVLKKLNALVKKLEEELRGADLFAPLPPTEDCPICFDPLPRAPSKYQACCGKIICTDCTFKRNRIMDNAGKDALVCPFCREPLSSREEWGRQLRTRASKKDCYALNVLGNILLDGNDLCALPKDELKGMDHLVEAAELGSQDACVSIAFCHLGGLPGAMGRRIQGKCSAVPFNEERAAFFLRVGALRGCVLGHEHIGRIEYMSGNHELGIRHWKVAAEAGFQPSLKNLEIIRDTGGHGKELISKAYLDDLRRACREARGEAKDEGTEDLKCVIM